LRTSLAALLERSIGADRLELIKIDQHRRVQHGRLEHIHVIH
jgi:hypothetical protein